MSIKISCKCGKTFLVRDELAGKKGRCPFCRRIIEIPVEVEVIAEQPEQIQEELQDIFSYAKAGRKEQDLVFSEYCFYRNLGYTEDDGWHISRDHPVQSKTAKSETADLIIGKKIPGNKFVPIILVEVGMHYNENPSYILMRALGYARVPYFDPAIPVVGVGNGEKHIMYNSLTEAPFPEPLVPEEAVKWQALNQLPLDVCNEPLDYFPLLKGLLMNIPDMVRTSKEKRDAFDPHEYEKNLLTYYSISSLKEMHPWDAEAEVKRLLSRYKWKYTEELLEMCQPFLEKGYPEIRELREMVLERQRLKQFAAVNDEQRKYRFIAWIVAGLFCLTLSVLFRRLRIPALVIALVLFGLSYFYFNSRRGPKPTLAYYELDKFLNRWAGRSERTFNALYVICAIVIIALFAMVLL